MWHIVSFEGLLTLVKEVSNWYSVLAVYLKIKTATIARFRDGGVTAISRLEYHEFQEELFVRYLQDKGYRYSTIDGKKVVRIPEGLQVMCSKLPFSAYINETFREGVYGIFNLKGRICIDLGAYVAETCLYFAMQGASKVYGFEIEIENYKMGLENIKLNNMENKIQLYHQPATYELLRNLIVQYDINNGFLKIDCEGCEYEIIEKADLATFKCIDDIILEYHRRHEPIMQKLKKLGYKVKRNREIIYATRKGQIG
jgi:predicted nucleic-acid-binding Zn-ribbon protein